MKTPLWVKLALLMIGLVSVPLVASAYFVGQFADLAGSFGAAEAEQTLGALDRASGAYHDLFETTKRLQAEIADRLSKRRDLKDLTVDLPLAKILDEESRLEPSLRRVAVVNAKGVEIAVGERKASPAGVRDKVVEQPLGEGGDLLRLTFEVSSTLQTEMQQLKHSLDTGRKIADQRAELLAHGFQYGFIGAIASFALIAVLVGIFLATRQTRRIDALVVTARRVGRGELDERVRLRGRDEMAELGTAFDAMLDQLAKARRDLEHQQRMSVWQDVARQLAHEIKNPLTPIQLAVQECVSQYKGDDARHKATLALMREIVEEEIASLGRLVDTFRTLGTLPKVAAAPTELAEVIEELQLQPQLASTLELVPPATPVVVRADKLLLKRVLVNLVENGIHAGEEAGDRRPVVVSWSADASAGVVRITVDDHGKGIAAADRDKIFEPYVTTKATGTGLGLAISRKIVIEHGGELTVASHRAPTGGARFVVSLPLRTAEQSLV